MARRKNTATQETTVGDQPSITDLQPQPSEASGEPEPFTLTAEHPKSKTRLSIPLTEDGAIDFDSIRASNRPKVVAALSHPSTLAVVSEGGPAPLSTVQLSAETIHGILAAESTAKQFVARAALHAPADLASACMSYTPEERDTITPVLQAFAEHHTPAFIAKHQDWLALLSVWGMVTAGQFARLKAAMAERQAQQRPRVDRPEEAGAAA